MPQAVFKRAERVSQLLQKELGNLLIKDLMDPRVGFVTVTEVRVTDDLRSARVYVSIYGTGEECQASLDGLRAAAGYLKSQLGRRIHLRYTPTLTFALDTTLDQVDRLDALISAASDGAVDSPGVLPRPVLPVQTPRSERVASAEILANEHRCQQENPRRQSRSHQRRHKPRV